MSLLAGGLTWLVYERLIHLLTSPFRLSIAQRIKTIALGIAVCALLGGAAFHIYRANTLLLLTGVRLPTDRIVAFELRQRPRDDIRPRVALFRIPKLAREELYWDMVGTIQTRDLEGLVAAYNQSPERFYIVTKVGHIPRIAQQLNIEAYTLLPPRGLRRQWLAVLYLGQSPAASELTPVRQEIRAKIHPAFSLGFPQSLSLGVRTRLTIRSSRRA